MRIVKILIALPMILLFEILRLFATAISWLYCRAASLLFIPMIILLILSVIATQWLAVGIIGAVVVACFILLFTIGWIEVELNESWKSIEVEVNASFEEFSKDYYLVFE